MLIISTTIYGYLGATILIYVFIAFSALVYLTIVNLDKVVQNKDMRQLFAIIINEYSVLGRTQVNVEKDNLLVLQIQSQYQTIYLQILNYVNTVSIEVTVIDCIGGNVSKSFSFPKIMDQFYMVRMINDEMSSLLEKNVCAIKHKVIEISDVHNTRYIRKAQNGQYEICDSTTNKIITLPDYKHVQRFVNGFAIITMESWRYNDEQDKSFQVDQYGVIDINGCEILSSTYDEISILNSNFLKVRNGNDTRLVNNRGQILIYNGLSPFFLPKEYVWGWNFSDGLAKAKKTCGQYDFINTLGTVVFNINYFNCSNKFINGCIEVKDYRGQSMCINKLGNIIIKNGNTIVQIPRKYDWAWDFHNGLARVKSNNLYGYINIHNEEVIPIKYSSALDFSDNLAIVGLNGKYGCINIFGNIIIPIEYDAIESFYEGVAIVRMGGRPPCSDEAGDIILDALYGLVNSKGEIIIKPKYNYIGKFQNKLAFVKYEYKYLGYYLKGSINLKGELLVKNGKEFAYIPSKYDWGWDFHNGIAIVTSRQMNKRSFGLINAKGEELSLLKYDEIKRLSNGLFRVCIEGKYGYVNTLGTEITSLKYSEALDFSEGYARVAINGQKIYAPTDEFVLEGGQWGFINDEGFEIVPLMYNNARNYKDGLAAVQIDCKWGFIDKQNNIVIPPIYTYVKDFCKEYAVVCIDNNWGAINRKGDVVISLGNIPANAIHHELVILNYNGKVCYLSLK